MTGEIHPFTVTKFDAAPAGAEENSCNSCVLTPARSAPEDAEPSGNRIHESTMHAEEKHLIDGLFSRLREVEGHTAAREVQAEALINEHLARQPAAPYYMAQAIIVQENALQQLDGRVRELEAELEALKRAQQSAPPASSGGFLAGLFGGSRNPAPATTQPVSDTPSSQPARSGWQEPSAGSRPGFARPGAAQPGFAQRSGAAQQGGGFLAGALQTAAGVAGGMLLGNLLMDMFQGDEAEQVAEQAPAAADEQALAAEEPVAQEEYYADGGEEGDFFADDEDFV